VKIIGTNTRVTTYIFELFGHAPTWQNVCLCHKISCTPLLWCCTVFVQSKKQFSYWGQRISKFMVKYVYNVFTWINMFLMYFWIKFFCCGTLLLFPIYLSKQYFVTAFIFHIIVHMFLSVFPHSRFGRNIGK
jgi:hypothetical protein